MLPPLEQVSFAEFHRRLENRESIWPGDGVLSVNPNGWLLSSAIAKAQYYALMDINFEGILVKKPLAKEAAHYTHYMVAHGSGVYENDFPHCRSRSWHNLLGTELLFVRPNRVFLPQTNAPEVLARVVDEARKDVEAKTPYPAGELGYYLKYVTKAWRRRIPFMRNRSFFDMFDNGDDDVGVCSAMGIVWLQRAGILPLTTSLHPNGFYPARYIVDPRFETVARLIIV